MPVNIVPRPTGLNGDPFLRLQRDIDHLHKQLDTLRSGSRTTIPIYPPSVIDELSQTGMNDGEVYIQDSNDKMYFVSNGVARQITSSP